MRTETQYIETKNDGTSDGLEEKRVVATENREVSGNQKAINVIYAIVGIVSGIIALRFLLLLFGANPYNNFAEIVYNITEPFVKPFYGLFSSTPYTLEGVTFEVESLIAIAVLALIGWAIVKLLSISKAE